MIADEFRRRPIQVLLDTGRFIQVHEKSPPKGNKDFFEGDNEGFATHKARLIRRIESIADAMASSRMAAGFLRTQLRENALGKSYRPLSVLFTPHNSFAFVGTDTVGELLIQATPDGLRRLAQRILERAEVEPRKSPNRETGELEERPSRYRAEVGALSELYLHDEGERVRFSAAEAVEWMSQPGVLGGYIVELFRTVPSAAPEAVATITQQFIAALQRLPVGLRVRHLNSGASSSAAQVSALALTVQLVSDARIKDLQLLGHVESVEGGDLLDAKEYLPDLTLAHHASLIDLLSQQSLVRSVELPPMLEAAPAGIGIRRTAPTIPPPAPGARYPVVGVIDGGIAELATLTPWRAGSARLVSDDDKDHSHGTFIAGLLAGGVTLNPHLAGKMEQSGCKFYDLDIFPRKELRRQYYSGDIDFFFDLLDEKIREAKERFKVRVFNLSFGVRAPSARFGYTVLAERMDNLARNNDVLLVVSAGNLEARAARPLWPRDANAATAMLAGFSGNQQISPPAEQFLGLTVGAINSLGVPGHEPDLPTTYTRRGPGAGGSRKPDLSHYGGVSPSPSSANRTGLASLGADGASVEQCGTSFAAPIAASTLATLDFRLEESASRETLLVLPVHRAIRASYLSASSLRHIARDFVGFGTPPVADEILQDEDSAITLLFSDVLMRGRMLEFAFAWPGVLTLPGGRCRGRVALTLAFTPPIDAAHRDEAMRVELDAHLSQESYDPTTMTSTWDSALTQDGSGLPQGMPKTERYMLMAGLKWSPIKKYHSNMRGRGSSSNWKLSVTSLSRAGAPFPRDGIPFSLLLSISDPLGKAPVHDQMRNTLQSQGVALADITVAHRIRQRP